MERLTLLALAALLAIGSPAGVEAAGVDARAIMQKADDRDDGDNATGRMEMVLTDKHGNERLRNLKTFRKDKGEDTMSLMFFLAPADVKGTGFLSYDYDDPDKDDDQWLYLPALHKAKRIATSDKTGSFMGSDLTYADMTSRNIERYRFKYLQDDTVDGAATWVIDAHPNEKEVEDTGYTRSILWVRKDNYVVVRAKNWLKDGDRQKYQEVQKLEKIDGIWVSTEQKVTTRQGKNFVHQTILRLHDMKFNQNLSEDLFSVRTLEKGL